LKNFSLQLEKHHRKLLLRIVAISRIRGNYGWSRGVGHRQLFFRNGRASFVGIAAEQNSVPRPAMFVATVTAPLRPPARRRAIRVRAAWRSALGAECRIFEQLRDGFGFFDGDGADQHRLAALVILADACPASCLLAGCR